MSLHAWFDYQAREAGMTPAKPETLVVTGVPSLSDPLASAIRENLDQRALGMALGGIEVEEHEEPGNFGWEGVWSR